MMTADYDYVTCVADLRTQIGNMEALLILNSVFFAVEAHKSDSNLQVKYIERHIIV